MGRRRSSVATLGRLLNASLLPVYVVDQQRRIVYANEACGRWLGLEPDELVGQQCDFHAGRGLPRVAELAAQLCPPPQAFAGQPITTPLVVASADGSVQRRTAQFLPLGWDSPTLAGVFALVQDAASEAAASPDAADEWARLHEQLLALHHQIEPRYRLDQLLGTSPAMCRVRLQVATAALCSGRVLVRGPRGSGRDHVARTIHYGSRGTKLGHLVPLSCALLDAELLQSTITEFVMRSGELRGDEPASLLLLDVDRLPADAQMELAGFLALPEVELPVIATSEQCLVTMAREGRYHRELAFLLTTLVIELPPLRERLDDLSLLAQHFLELQNAAGQRQLAGFTPEALDQLANYDWPDNLDELAAVVRDAARRARGPLVAPADLPPRLEHADHKLAHPAPVDETIQLDQFLVKIETELIRRALERAKGNKARAARLLGVTRARVQRRAAQLGLG